MRMYTSGWPKIQNRCCHKSGSAPALTSKNVGPEEPLEQEQERAPR